MAFTQHITLVNDGAPILNARFVVAAVNAQGRPCFPQALEALL
jgi:hypothetical protein